LLAPAGGNSAFATSCVTFTGFSAATAKAASGVVVPMPTAPVNVCCPETVALPEKTAALLPASGKYVDIAPG